MISFGPAVEDAHTPHERANIASVERFWEYLVTLLRVLAGKDAVPVS
jgi:dipeptidase D